MDTRRPRSSHKVSMTWEEDESTVTHHRVMQFADECIETKTVTTTTTTKRSYPPLFLREPRDVRTLDSKEYPLAAKPTPPELRKLTFELDNHPMEDWEDDYDLAESQPLRSRSVESAREIKREPGVDSPTSTPSRRIEPPELFSRRSSRITGTTSPSHTPVPNRTTRLSAAKSALVPHAGPEKLRQDIARTRAARPGRRSSGYLATPNASSLERASRLRPSLVDPIDSGLSQSTSAYDVDSPADLESQTFSNVAATPPVTEVELQPFEDVDDSFSSALDSHPRRGLNAVANQDVSLPSPRLSPTLAATQPQGGQEDVDPEDVGGVSFSTQLTRSDRHGWLDESQMTDDTEVPGAMELSSTSHGMALSRPRHGGRHLMDPVTMLDSFDAMPNELKTWMMYQFLRRCPRKTLHVVADVVNPALKCDFLKQLPLELSLHVLSYLDHRDLCRAAQVSKHWRTIIDTNETGWKELFDRDGFKLPPGELQRAINEGWGWQDPVGFHGCEVDLSNQSRLTSSESELLRSVVKTEQTEYLPRTRGAKRKRALTQINAERAKRRASGQDVKDRSAPAPKMSKSEGPISAANAAALAVPDPQIGLPSLRQLHLFKSLYRRHYMFRKSWMSGKVKPGHVAFAAHPRHVITCLQFDDDKIVTGSDDTLIHVYDTKTGKLRTKLEGHEGGVWALQYEGNTLVSGSTDRTVRVWDIAKGLCTHTFYGHTSTVRCLQIVMPVDTGKVQDGKPVMMPPKPLIITGSRDSQLRVWRLPEAGSRRYIQTGPPASDDQCPYFIRILSGHTHSVRAISAYGDTLVSGSYDSSVRVWRISTGEQLHVLNGHVQKVYSVVLDHKRNRCISGSMDSMVKIWDLATGACLYTLEGHSMLVGLLDLRDDQLVSAAADSTLRIWDPETGKCRKVLEAHTGAITCFQHDGRKVISGSEKTVKMWDVATGDCVQDLLTDLSGVWQVKFDDRRCVAAVQRGQLTYVEILDFGAVRDGKPPEELGKRKLLNEAEVQRLIAEES
ncbi:hypothetical protein VTJ04DRAFT_10369 [Mycothermus thermophilus]|uniref:uncharacterized protein n=1 Tax=Humicola insolens TaxID=85995 RepID=UPI003743545F